MVAILVALGLVTGLVGLGIKESVEPSLGPALEKRRLAGLKAKLSSALQLNEAEDGLVLARRYGDKQAAGYFEKQVTRLRKTRTPI